MTRIESDIVDLNKSQSEVFTFLSDFNNYQKIMPEQVTDWTSTADNCKFTIKGMATLGMQFESKTPESQIKIIKKDKAPFDFILYCEIQKNETDANKSKLQLLFDADLNPMLKMLAETPLRNFLNILAANYKKLS